MGLHEKAVDTKKRAVQGEQHAFHHVGVREGFCPQGRQPTTMFLVCTHSIPSTIKSLSFGHKGAVNSLLTSVYR